MKRHRQQTPIGTCIPAIGPAPLPIDNTIPWHSPPSVLCPRCGESIAGGMGCQGMMPLGDAAVLAVFHAACFAGDG